MIEQSLEQLNFRYQGDIRLFSGSLTYTDGSYFDEKIANFEGFSPALRFLPISEA
jgi:hypothetical protein